MSEYSPRGFDYDLVKKMVFKYLWKNQHEKHFEDCVQYCALEWFEGRTNLQWSVSNYCRSVGLGDKGKPGERVLEHATLVGLSTDENEDKSENGYLLDQYAVEKHKEETEIVGEECRKTFMGRLEEFLLPVCLDEETFKWVKRTYRPKLSKINAKIFNTLRTRST